jgi:hypothetical protein
MELQKCLVYFIDLDVGIGKSKLVRLQPVTPFSASSHTHSFSSVVDLRISHILKL